MRHLLYIFLLCFLLEASEYKNELAKETSPYLQQHADNPIAWLPWGEKAFLKAKKESKPVFLSIGYSTCHWCHVMEKESFENEKMAALFNKYFICIKVDKEEFPHLDIHYQKLHLKVNKHVGGWPLSAFLTADKEPFYLGTYIPASKKSYHEGLDTLLPRLYKQYTNDYPSIQVKVQEIKKLAEKENITLKSDNAKISIETLKKSIFDEYDDIYGGFGKQKKFPEASKLSLMMDLAILENDDELKNFSLEMLDIMALRGLYDHVEGGFFRYSVDAAWEIPHFEKMLYNQAELIPLYLQAYESTHKELYKNIVIETIQMLDKRFVKNNLYYSASDADSHHKEGEYFTFTRAEIQKALLKNPHAKLLKDSLDYTLNGNFEKKVHLNFFTVNRVKGFKEFIKELKKVREKKEYPFVDKKINTAWNALMIEALYKTASLDKKYLKKADIHLDALVDMMFIKGELYHQSVIGVAPKQKALLEDYSFLISALLSAYEVDLKPQRLHFVELLLKKAIRKFYKDGVWYLSEDELRIEADLNDKYYTSALGKMLQNILIFASLKDSLKYEELAVESLESINADLEKKQAKAPSAAKAFLMQKIGVVTLKNNRELLMKYAKEIKTIKYPYLYKKSADLDQFLACGIGRCFSMEKEFSKIKKEIEINIRK